jgi:hypothetical protein
MPWCLYGKAGGLTSHASDCADCASHAGGPDIAPGQFLGPNLQLNHKHGPCSCTSVAQLQNHQIFPFLVSALLVAATRLVLVSLVCPRASLTALDPLPPARMMRLIHFSILPDVDGCLTWCLARAGCCRLFYIELSCVGLVMARRVPYGLLGHGTYSHSRPKQSSQPTLGAKVNSMTHSEIHHYLPRM